MTEFGRRTHGRECFDGLRMDTYPHIYSKLPKDIVDFLIFNVNLHQ